MKKLKKELNVKMRTFMKVINKEEMAKAEDSWVKYEDEEKNLEKKKYHLLFYSLPYFLIREKE